VHYPLSVEESSGDYGEKFAILRSVNSYFVVDTFVVKDWLRNNVFVACALFERSVVKAMAKCKE